MLYYEITKKEIQRISNNKDPGITYVFPDGREYTGPPNLRLIQALFWESISHGHQRDDLIEQVKTFRASQKKDV